MTAQVRFRLFRAASLMRPAIRILLLTLGIWHMGVMVLRALG
jgi:hypothetical protein